MHFFYPFYYDYHVTWELLGALASLAGVALYVLRSLGLYRMSKNTGLSRAWFAWIPFLHEYQCARMGDRARKAQGKTEFLCSLTIAVGVIAVAGWVLRPIFWHIFLVGWIFRLAYSLVGLCWLVASVLADYWLYTDFEPSMAALYTILSVVRLDGIAKFLIRGNVPVGVAGACIPKQPKY